jgi:IS5 family transposase
LSWSPQKSVLQRTISAIRPEAWEAINRALLSGARQAKLEDGAVVRLDSTVTAALMHEPSDSSLLWDAVRVMVRLLKRADALIGGAGLEWRDHCRAARKRARKVQFTRGRPNRVQLYRELIAITRATLVYLKQASERLSVASTPPIALWQVEVRHYRPLVERIKASGGCLMVNRYPPARSWSACSRRMPILSSKAAATPSTATNSTWPAAAAA